MLQKIVCHRVEGEELCKQKSRAWIDVFLDISCTILVDSFARFVKLWCEFLQFDVIGLKLNHISTNDRFKSSQAAYCEM